jgi:predicted acylesterase/phospholipase RssA
MERPRCKRAITLAGGGPAAGLHIGVLLALDEFNRKNESKIEFDVWALSCIGAWVGLVYHGRDDGDRKAKQTYELFRERVFRDDTVYERFPINRAFGPDPNSYASAWADFVADPQSYRNLVLPHHIAAATLNAFLFWANPRHWMREGDQNEWWLNEVLAVNPASRFLTSLIHLSAVNGLTKIYYPDSSFLEELNIPRLRAIGPEIYYNAWKLKSAGNPQPSMQLFRNKRNDATWQPISEESLCACSALPYIEQTVKIGADEYCEGALVDTVNFKDLLQEYPELEEVWVVRIVDANQVEVPKGLADGLANLCMLFAAEVGENDVKLFKQHLRKRRLRKPRVIEIPVTASPDVVNFRWNHANLDNGVRAGAAAMNEVLERYAARSPLPSSLSAARTSPVSAPSSKPARSLAARSSSDRAP